MPHEHSMWFSFDKKPIDREEIIVWSLLFIAAFGILMGGLWLDLLRSWWIFPVCYIFPLMVGAVYETRLRQRKQYRCDEETWQALLKEIESMFGSTLTTET